MDPAAVGMARGGARAPSRRSCCWSLSDIRVPRCTNPDVCDPLVLLARRPAPRSQAPFAAFAQAQADAAASALDPSEWRPLKLVAKKQLTHNSFEMR